MATAPAPLVLDQRVCVVTGAASGIGLQIASRFIRAGAQVWLADRDAMSLEQAAQLVGDQTRCVQLDVRDPQSWQELARKVLERDGVPDVLVNNAGIGAVGTLLDTDLDTLEALQAVNVRGVFLGCKTFVSAMIERRRGVVINLASVGGLRAIPDRLAYCATKFAVVGLTRCMALDHAGSGVRFNCLCPGRVATSWVEKRIAESDDPEQAKRDCVSSQPIGRMIRPEEVAEAALFLASDAAEAITGTALSIDGGWTAA